MLIMYNQSNAIICLKHKAKLIYISLRIYLNNRNLVEMGNALDFNCNSILNGVKCLVMFQWQFQQNFKPLKTI
jgi:hypothetical protein